MSNPITSAIPSSSPITSVAPATYTSPLGAGAGGNQQLLSRLNLDLRGTVFTVDRETLMLLPESVLLGLFPQGLVLTKQGWGDGEEGVVGVDFDAACFNYILTFWHSAQNTFYGSPTTSGRFHAQSHLVPCLHPGASASPGGGMGMDEHSGNPLLVKQAIIVLREELEYFSITKPGGLARTDINSIAGTPNEELKALRRAAGRALEETRTIFTALQRNVSKENNLAEQHLIDMLCMRDDEWGFRACEPNRNIISSMALVLLKTGIGHPGDADYDTMNDSLAEEAELDSGAQGAQGGAGRIKYDAAQMATAQKLLLFWRKPARKCWWDGVDVDVPVSSTSKETHKVKVWARRVWTLELSLI